MDDLLSKLAEMRKSYINSLPETFKIIDEIEENIKNNNCNIDDLKSFMQIVHKISGTSGILGVNDLSQASSELEIMLKKIIKAEADFNVEKPLIIDHINKLRKVYAEISVL